MTYESKLPVFPLAAVHLGWQFWALSVGISYTARGTQLAMATHMYRLCGVLAIAKGCSGTPSPDAGPAEPPPPPPADWIVGIDPATTANHVSPALLGQYDLSGSLLYYQSNAAAVDAMKAIGFPEWRVGVGRWEFATRMLPTL